MFQQLDGMPHRSCTSTQKTTDSRRHACGKPTPCRLRSDIQGQTEDFLKLEAEPNRRIFSITKPQTVSPRCRKVTPIPDQSHHRQNSKNCSTQYVSRTKNGTNEEDVHYPRQHTDASATIYKGYNRRPERRFRTGCQVHHPQMHLSADYSNCFYDLFHKYLEKDVCATWQATMCTGNTKKPADQ